MEPAADRQWIMWNCNLPWTSRTKLDTQYLRCRLRSPGKHQTGSCLGFDMTDIWHWIFGEADARHSSWIRERFGKHHDDSVVGHVLGSGLIKLFCLFRVFPRDFSIASCEYPLGLSMVFVCARRRKFTTGPLFVESARPFQICGLSPRFLRNLLTSILRCQIPIRRKNTVRNCSMRLQCE